MQALGDNIILKKDERPERIGSIYIPSTNSNEGPPYSGRVISVGNKIKDGDIIPGVRITFNDLAGITIEYKNETFLIIKYNNITSVIDEKIIII